MSDLNRQQLQEWAAGIGLPRFRAAQIYAALSRRGIQEFAGMTELPASLRRRLEEEYRLRALSVRVHLHSAADLSEKVLFGLRDGSAVETVLIRGENAGGRARHTVCVSSQVGCPAGCTFCATGLSGFTRNLTAGEIVDQVMFFSHRLQQEGARVSNVVFMGMGEPLLNVRAVREAVARLTDPVGLGLGARSITVSTVGIVPQVKSFADWSGQTNLAISLHAPNDDLRNQLVPYNRHFPIKDLLHAVSVYLERTRRRVSFEYVLLRGTNDRPAEAQQLAGLLRPYGGLAHVNLIPWNPFREGRFIRGEGPDANAFAEILRVAGINATIRHSKGLDISAACGQLRKTVADE
ncbi:MAG TPA: 23S rRNA (adenine(2503)-C(2))-methyltransferase RlmN [Chloroflexota bacterium]|nr:23S rRNA (adenine(2503)-C(2))-methyltransferase RlmN [Chloroflexota bacterium]